MFCFVFKVNVVIVQPLNISLPDTMSFICVDHHVTRGNNNQNVSLCTNNNANYSSHSTGYPPKNSVFRERNLFHCVLGYKLWWVRSVSGGLCGCVLRIPFQGAHTMNITARLDQFDTKRAVKI